MATVRFALYQAKDYGKKGDAIFNGEAVFELLPKGAPPSPLHGDWVSANLWDVRDVFAGQDVAVAHSDYAPKRVTVNTRPPIEVILSRR
jgi:hypothetical protein